MSELFGDLFIQNDKEYLNVPSIQTIPVRGRHPSHLAGLQNKSATCYLNSLLQILYFTRELRGLINYQNVKTFSKISFAEGILSLTKQELNLDIPGKKTRKILLELQKLFANLYLRDEDAVSTSDLTNSFGWDNDEESYQQDIQELNRVLFSAMEKCLQGTSKENLIKDLYHGINIQKIACMNCKSISEREEEVFDISVPVKNMSSLQDALSAFYCQAEIFKGDNQYYCESCQSYVNANKDVGQLSFPTNLDMKIYCEEDYSSSTEYELYAVVAHSGGTHGGHYRAYIKDIENLGCYDYEDENETTYKKQKNNQDSKLTSPFDVIKEILIDYKDGITIDILATKINTYCGTSWKKKFKNRYGTLRSFLEKNKEFNIDECFEHVCLNDQKEKDEKKDAGDKTHHWFLLNDSKVERASIKDIQKLYNGSDSAYMLFYGKTDSKPGLELFFKRLSFLQYVILLAPKSIIDTIPEWLKILIKEANQTLAEKRKEFDDSLMKTSINIIDKLSSTQKAEYVIFDNNFTESKIEINLNWSIKKLKTELNSSMMNLPTIMENLVIMQVKKLETIPNVFKLENQYNYPDHVLLSQTSIYGNCFLAFRDSSKTDIIRSIEKIFLRLISFDSNSVLHPFLTDINYEEFLQQAVDLLKISDNELDVKIIGNSKHNERILNFEELKGYRIDEIFQEFDTVLIQKENHQNKEKEIIISKTETLHSLLKLAVTMFNLSTDNYHFCHCNNIDEVGDPMQQDTYTSSLAALNFHSGKHLIIMEGRMPQKDRLELFLLCANSSFIPEEGNESANTDENIGRLEITIDCNTSLKKFKQKIAQKLVKSVPSVDFLRCRLVENGKKTVILKNSDLTLRKEDIENFRQDIPLKSHKKERGVIIKIDDFED
ncbi:DgyrCDS6026 [Dimorphilus gyrociliatus]|uniref:DgyrCDS6026 n=1 Tax=Dimorphilus gyrociliatus TaxID=2664684 RepID=A0A7I8VND2_9ANNE|nr:DgyrCDS6026 [Dimorphilus gyrociliatus]